jgi:hypothetical protein
MATLIKILLACFLGIFYCHSAIGQISFQRTYGGPGNDVGRAIIESTSGGYIIVGSTNSYYDVSTDIYLLRLDENGDYIWGRNIGSPGTVEWGTDLIESENGEIYISGYTNNTSSGSYDGLLVKVDNAGNVIWQQTYGEDDWDFLEALAFDENNDLILIGDSYRNGSRSGWILKANLDGNTVWEQILESSGSVYLSGVSICTSGTIAISGSSEQIITGSRAQLALTLNLDGEIQWSRSYPTLGDIDTGNCKCREPEGLVLIGTYKDDDETDLIMTNFSVDNGDIVWVRHENFESTIIANALDVDPLGNIATTGAGLAICCAEEDGLKFVFDSEGFFLGGAFGDVFGGSGLDIFYDVFVTSDRGYISVGESKSFGNNSQVMVALVDSLGNSDPTNEDFLDVITSTNQPTDQPNIILYPNPAFEVLYVEMEEVSYTRLRFQIIDLAGRVVEVGSLTSEKLDVSRLKDGAYTLLLLSEEGEVIRKAFIKYQR